MTNIVTYSSYSKPPRREKCSLSKVLWGTVAAVASLATLNVLGNKERPKPNKESFENVHGKSYANQQRVFERNVKEILGGDSSGVEFNCPSPVGCTLAVHELCALRGVDYKDAKGEQCRSPFILKHFLLDDGTGKVIQSWDQLACLKPGHEADDEDPKRVTISVTPSGLGSQSCS